MYVSIASADRRIWYVSARSARSCPTDQWRAKRRWPNQHTTSQPSTHHGMAIAVSASGLSVWGWAGQACVGQWAIDSQKKIREAEGRIEWTGQCLRDTAFLSDHHVHMVLRRRYPSCPLPYT